MITSNKDPLSRISSSPVLRLVMAIYNCFSKALKSFLEKSGSEASKKKMARYTNSINRLKEGEQLPEIKLVI